MATIPLTCVSLYAAKDSVMESAFSLLPLLCTVIQHIVLTYNMTTGNYVMMTGTVFKSQGEPDEIPEIYPTPEAVKLFEKYISTQKPYRNPKLRITDLAETLHTNRTNLSALINKTYGMNFSRYINRLRLAELESLRSDSKYTSWSEMDLVGKAGFSNYRGYKRFKKSEEERSRQLMN